MTAPAVTYTFSNNTIADGSQVSTNCSDLVTYISNRNDGSSTWDRLLVTSSSAVPLIVNNSSGTVNIANFQDNGTNVLTIANGGTTTITAVNGGTDKGLVVNNGTSTGNILEVQDNGTACLTVADGGIVTTTGVSRGPDGSVSAPTFSFTSEPDCGIYLGGAGLVSIAINGGAHTEFTVAAIRPGSDNTLSCGGTGRRWTELWAVAGTINTSSLSEKKDVVELKAKDISVPRAIKFGYNENYGELANRTFVGFEADGLPLEAHPQKEDGSYDMTCVYTNAVLSALCAGFHSLEEKIVVLESK